jgi:hypothetical protein
MKDNDLSLKFKLAFASVTAGAVFSTGAIVYGAAAQEPKTYDVVTATCSNGLTQTFHDAKVSPPELFPQWPVASPILVEEKGRVTSFSGNDCRVTGHNL